MFDLRYFSKKYDWSSNEMIICQKFIFWRKKSIQFSNLQTGSQYKVFYSELIQFQSYWISKYRKPNEEIIACHKSNCVPMSNFFDWCSNDEKKTIDQIQDIPAFGQSGKTTPDIQQSSNLTIWHSGLLVTRQSKISSWHPATSSGQSAYDTWQKKKKEIKLSDSFIKKYELSIWRNSLKVISIKILWIFFDYKTLNWWDHDRRC